MNTIFASLLMKEQRLRFNTDQDVRLLELAIEINPFEETYRWQRLHEIFVEEFKKPHSLRSCKDHVDIIIKQYLKGSTKTSWGAPEFCALIEQVIELKKAANAASLEKSRKSGHEIPENGDYFSSMNDESQSVSSTTTASNPDKKLSLHVLTCTDTENCDCKEKLNWNVTVTNQNSEEQDYSFNFATQGEAAEDGFQTDTFKTQYPNNTSSYMNHSGTHPEISDSTVLAYLKSKFSVEKETKEKELALEERKLMLKEKELELQKEKFDLEKYERSKRLEIELKERELHMKVIEQQQNLLNIYMKTTQFKM